jgi:hypothetical protein
MGWRACPVRDGRAEAPLERTAQGDAATEVDQVIASQHTVAASRWLRSRRSWRRRAEVITAILTGLTAVAALILSLISTVRLNRRADMSLTMPSVLRVAQGYLRGSTQVQLSIQPTFTVYEKTDITSVVASVHLHMTPPSQNNSAPPYFFWADIIEYAPNTSSMNVLSDPVPIVVTQDKPQALMMRFIAMSTLLKEGRWNGTITVERQGQSSLVRQFCIDIPADTIPTQPGAFNTVMFRNDDLLVPSTQTSNCYHKAVGF